MPDRDGDGSLAVLGDPAAFGRGEPAPDSERFGHAQGVVAAFDENGAATADRFRATFTVAAGVTPLAVGMKEHGRFDAAAQGVDLPVPGLGVGAGKASG